MPKDQLMKAPEARTSQKANEQEGGECGWEERVKEERWGMKPERKAGDSSCRAL